MLITEIKDKHFKDNYNNAIKFSNMSELDKFIAYIEEDRNRYDKLFGTPYSETQIKYWREVLENNLKKKRFRFVSIRDRGACYNGQNTNYLQSEKIRYSNISAIDQMLDMITMYEKKEEMSDTEKEIRSILDELAL
jgi:hypothetical protein